MRKSEVVNPIVQNNEVEIMTRDEEKHDEEKHDEEKQQEQEMVVELPEKEIEKEKEKPKAGTAVALLVIFMKILFALLIVALFDTEWQSCFTNKTVARSCSYDCGGSEENGSCRGMCYFGGQGTIQYCKGYQNATGYISNYCYNPQSELVTWFCTDHSYCNVTASSSCECNNWLMFSGIIVLLNVALYLIQIFFVWVRGFDPIRKQFEHIYEGNYCWLLNPWNSYVGYYDVGYLIAAAMLQLEYLSFGLCGGQMLDWKSYYRFCFIITLKEVSKLNFFLAMRDWRAGKPYWRVFLYFIRVDLMIIHYLIIWAQCLIGVFTSLTLFLPLLCFYSASKREPPLKSLESSK